MVGAGLVCNEQVQADLAAREPTKIWAKDSRARCSMHMQRARHEPAFSESDLQRSPFLYVPMRLLSAHDHR